VISRRKGVDCLGKDEIASWCTQEIPGEIPWQLITWVMAKRAPARNFRTRKSSASTPRWPTSPGSPPPRTATWSPTPWRRPSARLSPPARAGEPGLLHPRLSGDRGQRRPPWRRPRHRRPGQPGRPRALPRLVGRDRPRVRARRPLPLARPPGHERRLVGRRDRAGRIPHRGPPGHSPRRPGLAARLHLPDSGRRLHGCSAPPASAAEAGSAAALILAREDAGILEAAEAEPVARAVATVIREEKLGQLRQVWREAHRTRDDDARGMVRLGRAWLV
jgi:hypothetical protein